MSMSDDCSDAKKGAQSTTERDDSFYLISPTPTSIKEVTGIKRHLLGEARHFGWWWEVGAISVSLISTILIVAILLTMNNKPLLNWHLPIQINSLIAVFSTLSRSALLLVLTEGLSQLKWNHFEKSGGTLDQLQIFDDASRGPWGAFAFFFRMRLAFSALAATGATLTVLGLAFEPFTQQIIEFQAKTMPLTNETAFVSVAESFEMPEDGFAMIARPKLNLMQGIMTTLSARNYTVDSSFVCPTGDCSIPSHWSLATESSCDDEVIWDDVHMQCKYMYWTAENGTWFPEEVWLDNLQDYKDAIRAQPEKYGSSSAHCSNVKSDEPEASDWIFYFDSPHHRKFWVGPYWGSVSNGPDWQEAWPDNQEDDWSTEERTMILGVKGLIESSIFPPVEEIDTLDSWEGVKMSKRQCGLNLVGLHTEEARFGRAGLSKATRNIALNSSCVEYNDQGYCRRIELRPLQNDTSPSYKLSMRARHDLTDFLHEVGNDALRMPFLRDFLSNTTVEDVAEMLSSVVSDHLRSEQNVKATKVMGTAFGTETYVHIRWQWAILPFFIVVASVSFLIFTILETRKAEQLYKSSVLPGYLSSLEDRDDQNPKSSEGLRKMDNHSLLLKQGRQIRVKLWRDENGKLLLTKG